MANLARIGYHLSGSISYLHRENLSQTVFMSLIAQLLPPHQSSQWSRIRSFISSPPT
jgi:hypothetical protein